MAGDFASAQQQTLKTGIGCRGIGLHSGERVAMTLLPAAPDTGIVFRRMDAGGEIKAGWANTVESALCTVLSNEEGIRVSTVEHLMAALAGAGVDNAIVELDGSEVPVMDGSAAPFVFLIECAGVVAQQALRQAIKVLKPVWVEDGNATATLLPDVGFSMSFEIDFADLVIRRQDFRVVFDAGTFKAELSRARTFGFLDDVDRLRAAGFVRGGSLDNVVVVSGDRVLNRGGLRYGDEFVRHKLLDAYGDLYLAGGPIVGHFRGVRSGHALTRRLLAALFADDSAWCCVPLPGVDEPGPAWGDEPRRASA